MSIPSLPSRKRGIALIDLIMFIVIVGIALAGVVAAINLGTRNSADPLIEKQALAIAEALLEEVELMPFTQCTAGQSLVLDATNSWACMPNTTKTRGSATNPLDNVLDYNGIPALTSSSADLGGVVTVPPGYSATVAVATDTAVGAGSTVPANDMAHITVTVNYPGGSLVLEGYRSRYAPDENS